MTIPNIKDVTGRPAVELAGATADTTVPVTGASGICLIGAEWGDGLTSASVVTSERAQIARIPFPLSLERWEVLAYDASGDPLAISCVIEVSTADFSTNTFASITGTEQPSLSSETTHESVVLAGWTLDHVVDTMFRFELVSHTGSPAKIVLGIRAFAT